MSKPLSYVPGVCNIGPEERARRRQSGIVGTVVGVAVLAILWGVHAPRVWRIIVILPAFVAATGYVQAAFHFCAGFGLKGLYNVAKAAGQTESVTSAEYRRADQQKALQIFGLSLVMAIIVMAIAVAA